MTVESTKGMSRLRESLVAEFGPGVASDFEAMVDALAGVWSSENNLDKVTISLLAAANNEVMYYDVRHWGTDVGLASETTFSVTKTHLEELGVLETENVPTDGMGRPRQRLILGGDQFRRADPAEVVSKTRAKLGEGRNPIRRRRKIRPKSEDEGETANEALLEAGNRLADLVFRSAAVDIIRIVHVHGTIRYTELSDHLETGSPSTISSRLDELQEAGVIDRTAHDEIPPKVEYSLTESGERLYDRLCPLLEFLDEE